MHIKSKLFFSISLTFISAITHASSHLEMITSQYYDQIKNNPTALHAFIKTMPKGADLHMHATGSVLPETLLAFAKDGGFCIHKETLAAYKDSSCLNHTPIKSALLDKDFYNRLIDTWSMRNFSEEKKSGHDHFFNAFEKFIAITDHYGGELLHNIVERAARQNEIYLEILITTGGNAAGKWAKNMPWEDNLQKMYQQLSTPDFNRIVRNMISSIDADEKVMRKLLACETDSPTPGCHVKVRYIHQTLRAQKPIIVFAQLLAGFEAATIDSRIVGINMVEPEDSEVSMRDYKLHMKMIRFLRKRYPAIPVSLHAGELSTAIISKDAMSTHIHDAIKIARANRIGHGTDIMYEENAHRLLKEMAEKSILVETNLTSNEYILKVQGKDHPLMTYIRYGVPVTLSTDDEGITRSNLTNEYIKAATTYSLSYQTLKTMVRNSITYSFLPGKSIWTDHQHRLIGVCAKEVGKEASMLSLHCKNFLRYNEKAAMQWLLEYKLNQFEKNIAKNTLTPIHTSNG